MNKGFFPHIYLDIFYIWNYYRFLKVDLLGQSIIYNFCFIYLMYLDIYIYNIYSIQPERFHSYSQAYFSEIQMFMHIYFFQYFIRNIFMIR